MNNAKDAQILKDHIEIQPDKKPKKITATKLSQILGIGTSAMYTTPFQAWCDICHVYAKPFEENKYTNAGKHIEPKQLTYFKDKFNLSNLVTPEDRYGFRYQYMWDFFPEEKIFGGKWDSITIDLKDGSTRRIIECKTAQAKKRKDWATGIPSDYKVQAALYAYLMGVDGITFLTTFLDPEDYDAPEKVNVNDSKTIITQTKLSEYLNFENDIIKPAVLWWNNHVVTGVSPKFNEYIPEDKEILTYIKSQQEEEIQPKLDLMNSKDLPF